jgi:endonuclease/exonuclease/phosphatase (EEP) superfamily protein YafD
LRLRSLGASALAFALAGCVTLTSEPRAIVRTPEGVAVRVLACPIGGLESQASHARPGALDPDAIRVFTWNIHKQADAGWPRDLQALSRRADLLLLQEAVLDPTLRDLIDRQGLDWIMASSFTYAGRDVGVVTAARVPPAATCTTRALEPLLRIPKSAVVSWFALRGRLERLAVANVHAINFSVSLPAYRAQLDALADALRAHAGPLILAGDFNTWTQGREDALREVAGRLGLTEVSMPTDRRTRFFGHQVDRIYVRGLVTTSASAVPVTSSDHNPVLATVRVAACTLDC